MVRRPSGSPTLLSAVHPLNSEELIAVSRSACTKRSYPSGASRNISSPNVITSHCNASSTRKLPPIAAVFSNARYSSMFSRLTPPVGMNFTCGKGALSALSAFKPP